MRIDTLVWNAFVISFVAYVILGLFWQVFLSTSVMKKWVFKYFHQKGLFPKGFSRWKMPPIKYRGEGIASHDVWCHVVFEDDTVKWVLVRHLPYVLISIKEYPE